MIMDKMPSCNQGDYENKTKNRTEEHQTKNLFVCIECGYYTLNNQFFNEHKLTLHEVQR